MSSRKQKESLGRSILRQREKDRTVSSRHTTDFGGASNAVSITENTSVEEFLSQAEAAQRSFEAERGKVGLVRHEGQVLDEEGEEENEIDDHDGEGQGSFCSIPKKPDWKGSESAEEYARLEQEVFLRWRRRLNAMQRSRKNVPPFEKNLEFWRQLWKMVELSDVVVQVVDARDPLFYFNLDLASYVSEVDPRKRCVMLMNKADFLTAEQRMHWARHLEGGDVNLLFFSAVGDDKEEEEEAKEEEEPAELNTSRILSPTEVLRAMQRASLFSPLTVGFVGYPNVGKSSTINRFLSNKKLQVSETPGKTKHYQTHVLSGGEVRLVDGPGLVMPSLDMTKAEMVLGGILPIDNLTDFLPPVELLLSRIPATSVEDHYGVLSRLAEQARRQTGDRKASEAMQVLSALAMMRGFMKPGGVPDHFRAARIVLKDYVQGKLLYCKAPPGVDQALFCPFTVTTRSGEQEEDMSLEESFPELNMTSGVHVRGVRGQTDVGGAGKGKKKHGNKKKREKARRVYKTPNAE